MNKPEMQVSGARKPQKARYLGGSGVWRSREKWQNLVPDTWFCAYSRQNVASGTRNPKVLFGLTAPPPPPPPLLSIVIKLRAVRGILELCGEVLLVRPFHSNTFAFLSRARADFLATFSWFPRSRNSCLVAHQAALPYSEYLHSGFSPHHSEARASATDGPVRSDRSSCPPASDPAPRASRPSTLMMMARAT